MNIVLTSNELDTLKVYSKVYDYLSDKFTKAYFKLSKGELTYFLRGAQGTWRTIMQVDYDGAPEYFSIDSKKWANALQKFAYADSINFSLQKNLIKLSVDGNNDVINFGISRYAEDTSEAAIMNTSFNLEDNSYPFHLTLTDDVMDDLSLASGLFISQSDVNSIGLGKKGVIYADRATILRTKFNNPIDDVFFTNLNEDEEYVYIHEYLIGLFQLLKRTNPEVSFNPSYDSFYWTDGVSEIILAQEFRELSIPTQEEINSIIPKNKDSYFEVSLEELKNALDFFTGFYEDSAWKPLTFTSVANKEISLRYNHNQSDITKELSVVCGYDGSFILGSDSVRKIAMKVKDRREDTTDPLMVRFTFDNEALGVHCEIGNFCDVIFAKLEDDGEESV